MIDKHLAIIIFALLLFGCNRHEPEPSFCNVEDPVNDLGWLNELIQVAPITKVDKCKFKEEEGFFIVYCVGDTFSYAQFVNCSGEFICQFSDGFIGVTCPDFWDHVTDRELLWETE